MILVSDDSKGPDGADTRLYGSKRSVVINRRVAIRSIGCRCNMLRSVKPCAVALRVKLRPRLHRSRSPASTYRSTGRLASVG